MSSLFLQLATLIIYFFVITRQKEELPSIRTSIARKSYCNSTENKSHENCTGTIKIILRIIIQVLIYSTFIFLDGKKNTTKNHLASLKQKQ